MFLCFQTADELYNAYRFVSMFSSIAHKIVPRSCFVRVLDCARILVVHDLNCARFCKFTLTSDLYIRFRPKNGRQIISTAFDHNRYGNVMHRLLSRHITIYITAVHLSLLINGKKKFRRKKPDLDDSESWHHWLDDTILTLVNVVTYNIFISNYSIWTINLIW